MRWKNIKKRMLYGMKRKISIFTVTLLLGVFIFSNIAIALVVRSFTKDIVIDKYTYINEKVALKLESLYEESDKITEKYISNNNIQKSLQNSGLKRTELAELKKELSYLTFDHMSNAFYMDNKGNVYSKIANNFDSEKFLTSDLYQQMGSEYSITKWIWGEDVLFGTNERALFIGRYIRHMDYLHKPGLLMLKMDEDFFNSVFEDVRMEENVIYYLLDSNDNLCYKKIAGESQLQETDNLYMVTAAGMRKENDRGYTTLKNGILLYQTNQNSKFTVVTFLSDHIFNQVLMDIFRIIFIVFALICILAIGFSVYFSKVITRPITKINDTMLHFDGSDFSEYISVYSNTELDTIGDTYNEMLHKIKALVNEVKNTERELYKSELDSLMYQINPHFLYNTLDNLYMLVRLNKDEKSMEMIQALSNFLRISLSKGKDEVTIFEELDHVRSYLDIQNIRQGKELSCDIVCEEDIREYRVLKLILQPLVENAIKHGFSQLHKDGRIEIQVYKEENFVIFSVWNNGIAVDEATCELLNQMQNDTLENIQNYFPNSQGGYGVASVVKRLRLRYQKGFRFQYQIRNEGTTCIIKIPAEEMQEGKE